MALGSPAKIINLKSWKSVYHEPPLILFCSLEPVECPFLRSDLTKYVHSNILEETRTTAVKSALSFQAGPGNTVDQGSCSKAFTALQPL